MPRWHNHPSTRLRILQDAYNSARHRGVHALLSPPIQNLATEIHGLLKPLPQLSLDRQKYQGSMLTLKGLSFMTAFCNHSLTKERMTLFLDCTPVSGVLYSPATERQRDRLVGSRTNKFSTQLTGLPICHLMYDDEQMVLRVVQYATALNNQEETATFLLLRIPNWMENSTNTFQEKKKRGKITPLVEMTQPA